MNHKMEMATQKDSSNIKAQEETVQRVNKSDILVTQRIVISHLVE